MALMIPPDQVDRLFSLLVSHRIDYRIFCEARAGLTKDQLAKMKRAGVIEVQIGLEALDTVLLGKMNKGNRLIDNLEVMKFCEELGIRAVDSFLLLGFPTETQDDIDRSTAAVDLACGYAPPSQIMPFSLRDGSTVDRDPERFGVRDVREVAIFEAAAGTGSISPEVSAEITGSSGVDYWFKDFTSDGAERDYSRLMRRVDRWRTSYDAAREAGQPILSYQDCGDFLIIEDYRDLDGGTDAAYASGRRTTIVLSGWRADLFRYCDSIRTFDDIAQRFSEQDSRRLRAALRELADRQVIFNEGPRYLALPMAAGADTRHKTTFPWS
jgi:radical SAM superfamily enzyme YgiQ (UPF0313 family)